MLRFESFWNNPDPRTRRLNRNVVYSTLVKCAGILLSLLLVPLTLNYLDSYEYGVWVTLLSVVMWINYFDIGLGNGLRNKLSEAIAKNDLSLGKEYVSTTLFLLSLISAGILVVFLIASVFIDWNSILNVSESVRDLRKTVNITAGCMFVSFTLRTVGVIHQSYQNSWVNDFFTFLGSLLSFVWIFVLTRVSKGSLVNVALAYSVSPLLVYLLALPYTFGHLYKSIKPSIKSVCRRHISCLGGLGLKFFLLQIACLVIFSTSNVLVSRWFSPSEVTVYSIAYRYYNVLILVFGIIISPMWSAVTDAYARRDEEWISGAMKRLTGVWLLFCVFALLMTGGSGIVLRLWIGNGFRAPMSLCVSLAIYNMIYMISMLISAYCNGTGHLRYAVWPIIAAALMFVPCARLLSEVMGVSGIALSMGVVMIPPTICMYYQYFYDIKQLRRGNG